MTPVVWHITYRTIFEGFLNIVLKEVRIVVKVYVPVQTSQPRQSPKVYSTVVPLIAKEATRFLLEFSLQNSVRG